MKQQTLAMATKQSCYEQCNKPSRRDKAFCIVEMLHDESSAPFIDFQILQVNSLFYKHTGLARPVCKTIRELVPDVQSDWIERFATVARTGQSVRFESFSTSLNRWFDIFACPLGKPGSGKVALLLSDITVRKKSQIDLHQLAADRAEADRQKNVFLATLAHELRNPLAPIRAGLGILRMDGLPPGTAQTLDMLDRQVSQMVNLIDDLLDIARISSGKLDLKRKLVALQGLVSTAIETSQPHIQAGQHGLTVHLPDEPLVLDADPTRIAQVLANLLNNAARYTPTGGRIELAVRRDGQQVLIVVTDDGIGLSQDTFETIFDRFSQIKHGTGQAQGGLGIGLSLVRHLIEMHGGTIVARSAGLGQGSTFTIKLPLSSASAKFNASRAVAQTPPVELPQSGEKLLRILVVDDHVDAAEALAAVLRLKGHTTQVAHSGFKAVELATQFKPEVAFLDIGMPGMDGHDTARALHKIADIEKIVLVALTGWGTKADRARSADAGFDHHLTKPAELRVVDALLEKIGSSIP